MIPEWPLLVSLVGGVLLLAIAGDFIIRGSVELSRRIGVSSLWTGLFVVGIGTSVPEIALSFTAVLDGYPGMAVGNIIGSNIANVGLVLALTALFFTVRAGGHRQSFALVFMLAATLGCAYALLTDQLLPVISIICLVGLGIYLLSSLLVLGRKTEGDDNPQTSRMSAVMMLVCLVVGIVGLPLGAHWAVQGGVGIAYELGVDYSFIGLTLLAIGTSLPELTVSIVAALRQQRDILIGNIVGSNTFNLLAAGALVTIFGKVEIAPTFIEYDVWVLLFSAAILSLLILFRMKVSRLAALGLLVLYGAYLTGLLMGLDLTAVAQRVFNG